MKKPKTRRIYEDEHTLILFDPEDGVYHIKATEESIQAIEGLRDFEPSVVCLVTLDIRDYLIERFGLDGEMICHQYYYPLKTVAEDHSGLSFRTAGPGDLALIVSHYKNYDEETLSEMIEEQRIMIGEKDGTAVGFIGHHGDGSMGLLEIFPEHRRQGYGAALQRELIRRDLQQGFVPYGHVVVGNEASMRLQEKLGMVKSPELIDWLFLTGKESD